MPEKNVMGRVQVALKSLVATLGIGFILFFYSETMFWGRPDRAPISELIVTWLVYSLLAYLFLAALATFRVRRWAALFLAGALYGWLGEGVLVQTMYDMFPINLSWTGLAWHSVISVCAGWYGLSVALQRGTLYAALTAAGLGLFWGLWAVMWWQPGEGGHVTPLVDFTRHVFTQGALLTFAYAAYPRFLSPGAFSSRWGRGIVIILAVLWFAFVAVPHTILALFVAPPLFALTLYALRRLGKASEEPSVLMTLRPVPLARYAAIFAMPLCATTVYALFLSTGRLYPTNQWFYYMLVPLGFTAYMVSLWLAYGPSRSVP
jgi:hypothetical protein